MKEFTFNCPTCGQPILASKDWAGRRMKCPSCETRIVIKVPTRPPKPKQHLPRTGTDEAKPRRRARGLPGFPLDRQGFGFKKSKRS